MIKLFKHHNRIILFLIFIKLINALPCNKSGIVCINSHDYQECSFINGSYSLTGESISCPSTNALCDDSTGAVICRTNPPVLTATELSVEKPTCSEASKHPAPACYQFYECVYVMWWWEAQLKTCPETKCFDIWLKECILANLVDCQSRTPLPGFTLTTVSTTIKTTKAATASTSSPAISSSSSITAETVTPPTCSGPGKYPASLCWQYYECEQNFLWWQPVLKTCIIGYAFDIIITACLPISAVDCQNRITTVSVSPPITTTITPSALPPIIIAPNCTGPSKHPAPNCYEYYECEQVAWWWEPHLKTCILGEAFDIILVVCAPIKVVDCQNRLTTTVSATTLTTIRSPDPIIIMPNCSGPGKYSAPNCNEYYECEPLWWWWEPHLKTCEVGQAFDIILIACAPSKLVDCQNRVTSTPDKVTTSTTTQSPAVPIVVVPTCTGPGKYPALNCNKYYECEQVAWWWEPRLKVCVTGQAFDIILVTCVEIKLVDCQNRVTETVPTTTTTITTKPPTPPVIVTPTCSGPGKYPAPNCYEYYECVQFAWWWEPKIKTCVVGKVFDIILEVCAPIKAVDCQNRLTTTVSPTTLSTTKSPDPIIILPTCSGPGKYPALNCNEYYECEPVWWWWEPKLKVCVVGQAFDTILIACAPITLVECQNRVTTATSTTMVPMPPVVVEVPTCSGPGKYPAAKCNEYYECEQKWWWWEPKLKVCLIGQGFDITLITCLPIKLVDCQNRITTTISTSTSIITQAPPIIVTPTCSGPGKYSAPNCYEYYECVQTAWWWEPQIKTCIIGEAFDIILSACAPVKLVNCQNRITTTVSTTAPTTTTTVTPPVVVPPTCSGPGRYAAPICYQYYECKATLWWWDVELKTCPPEEAYDIILNACYPIKYVNCQQRVTTPSPTSTTAVTPTTKPPSIQIPTCYGFSRHPAPLCYQFYECVSVWWWWEPKLKTCPDGEGYDHSKERCFCAEAIGCKVPIKEPKCYDYGKYPALNCNEYYECVSFLWWWTPQLKTCPKDQGFATSVMRCVDEGYDCILSDNSLENSSKENSSKEHNSQENSSKENNSHENSSKEMV